MDDGALNPFGWWRLDRAGRVRSPRPPSSRAMPGAHEREHSLEMQLPFLQRVLPGVPIVPVLIGFQRRATIEALAAAIAAAFAGRRALLVASTDLSHYFDAATAATLDGRVERCVAAFDPEGLLEALKSTPSGARAFAPARRGGDAVMLPRGRLRALRPGPQVRASGDLGDNDCASASGAHRTFTDAPDVQKQPSRPARAP